MRGTFRAAALGVSALLGATPVGAQAPLGDTDLAKESLNPVTRLYTVPLRYQAELEYGPDDDTKSTLELDQAVLPFLLTDHWALITRTKIPFVWQPPKKDGEGWNAGLGNAYTTLFLSPEHSGPFMWGVGPVIYFPVATTKALAGSDAPVGVNKWGSGPSVALVWKSSKSPWMGALVANNIWSFGGPPSGSDRTNLLLVNPILSYHFGDGWFIASSPNITANWYAAPRERWTLPVGGGLGHVVRLGAQPVSVSVDSYYNAIRPAGTGPVWLVELTAKFLFTR